jgi:predicted dehydrogenase
MASAKSRRIRYAVVGAGNIAQVAVLPGFKNAGENSELVAVISSDPDKRQALMKAYGLDEVGDYDSLEDVIKRAAVDAVYLALPNHLHRPFTMRAAQAGVHVLCEKPMATTVEDCEAMSKACADAGVKLMIAYRLHFEAANLGAIELIRAGKIGEPLFFSGILSQQVRAGDIRTREDVGGGALLDEGPYPINAARYLFGDEPLQVFGGTDIAQDARFEGVDSTAAGILRFPHGRLAQFTVSQAASAVSGYRVVGSSGDLQVVNGFDYMGERRLITTAGGRREERHFEPQDQFGPEILYFSRCILEDSEPEPSGVEGLADVRIIAALQESARTGQAVPLAPFEKRVRPNAQQLITAPAVQPPSPVHAPAPAIG